MMAYSDPGISSRTLTALRRDPAASWESFVRDYAGFIFTELKRFGFDHDSAMDRFVYVLDKLRANNWQRLRGLDQLRDDAAFSGWLRQVVRNLSIDWLRAVEGRKRLGREAAALPPAKRRVFELYFHEGMPPSAISEQLRREQIDLDLVDVLDAIEAIVESMSSRKIWRLLARLREHQKLVWLQDEGVREPASTTRNPETELMVRERQGRLEAALKGLATEQRLVVQFRFEEGLTKPQIATLIGQDVKQVDALLRAALYRLRKEFCPAPSRGGWRQTRGGGMS